MKNVQLETCEEQLDPPIVSNKNPWEALGHPLGLEGASAVTTQMLGRRRRRSAQESVRFRRPWPAHSWTSQTFLSSLGCAIAVWTWTPPLTLLTPRLQKVVTTI